jgi:hypothetical protein
MIKFLLMMLISSSLVAATVWERQPDLYNAYEVISKTGKKSIVRVKVSDVPDSVQPEWVKQDGQFFREVTAKGAVRFVPAPLPDQCVAQFICHAKWGFVVNISEDTVFGKCKAIKILNEQVVMYDNRVKNINCPTVLK